MRVIRTTTQVATSYFGAASIPLVVITAVSLMFLMGCGVGETSTSGGEVVPYGAPAPTVSGSNQGGGPAVAPGQGRCGEYLEFMIDSDNPNPTGPTPRQALNAALSSGTTGDGSLTQDGYPRSGWHPISVAGKVATFQAKMSTGVAQLAITEVTPNSWVLTSGLKRCPQP